MHPTHIHELTEYTRHNIQQNTGFGEINVEELLSHLMVLEIHQI